MDVFFVERNAQGQVVGLYATPQYGRAEEALPADDTEVAAFIAQQNGTTNNQGGSNA